jgi:hypothetical protein
MGMCIRLPAPPFHSVRHPSGSAGRIGIPGPNTALRAQPVVATIMIGVSSHLADAFMRAKAKRTTRAWTQQFVSGAAYDRGSDPDWVVL